MSIFSGTNWCRKRAKLLKPISSPTKPAKPDFWNGSGAGDEENGFTVRIRGFERRRHARDGRNARNAKRQADERCVVARVCCSSRAAATNWRQLRDGETRAVASHHSRGRNG